MSNLAAFLGDSHRWRRRFDAVSAELAGYCLTGLTKEQCIIVFYGPGANGKTVFIDVLANLLGDYVRTTPAATFMARRNPGGASPDLSRLRGSRLVLAAEPDQGAVLAEAFVKQVTGQDKIACRDLYGKFFEFYPQFKVILATNHKPIIPSQDYAIWRRMRLIPFNVIIPKEQRDRDLSEKLKAELSGILNWALGGLEMYLRDGLDPPDCVDKATQEYRSEMDIIGDWFDECCEIDPDAKVSKKDAYASYAAWSKESGHCAFSKKNFGRRLKERGIDDAKSGSQRLFLGFRLGKLSGNASTETITLDIKNIS